MRGLPLTPELKVALRNLDHAHAHSEGEARESHDVGCGARALKRLRKLGLASVVVETVQAGTRTTKVRRHFLTREGVDARRAMDV